MEDHRGECGFAPLIKGIHDGGNGAATDPVAGTLVRDGESPTSGACRVTGSVAAINDRAGIRAERGIQGDDSVADDFNISIAGRRTELGEDAADLRRNLGIGRAGGADANGADLLGRNSGVGASLANRGV